MCRVECKTQGYWLTLWMVLCETSNWWQNDRHWLEHVEKVQTASIVGFLASRWPKLSVLSGTMTNAHPATSVSAVSHIWIQATFITHQWIITSLDSQSAQGYRESTMPAKHWQHFHNSSSNNMQVCFYLCLQCYDSVGLASRRVSGL